MKGLLLVNTGSPASPHPKDVKAFITAMLSDPMVMTVPDWFRPILVKGIIGPFRQFSSSKKYKLIWGDAEQSQLIVNMQQLADQIEERTAMPTGIGMTYLNPSISEALDKLNERNNGLSEVIAIPLFPHYAESSYGTTAKQIQASYERGNYPFKLRIIEPYFNHPEYISALTESIKPYLNQEFDRFIFSFHSLPLSHVEKGFEKGVEFDYVYQVKETVRLVAQELKLETRKIRVVFSSAFGKDWLEPSLDEQMKTMGRSDIKKVLAISPGFASDNLETLYDINILARKIFLNHGGKEFTYIPCLNSSKRWVEAIQRIII